MISKLSPAKHQNVDVRAIARVVMVTSWHLTVLLGCFRFSNSRVTDLDALIDLLNMRGLGFQFESKGSVAQVPEEVCDYWQ